MICVVVLQNCMGFVEGETGSNSEPCVTCDVDGTEEVSINFEDAIDVKEEVSFKVEEAIDIKEEVSFKVEEAIDIKEEVSFKVEEAIDIEDEIPEAISLSPIKTEHEVRLWGVCEVVADHAVRTFIDAIRKL